MHVLLHSVPPTLQQATSDPHLCQGLLDTQRQVRESLVGSLLLSLGSWCTQGSVMPSKSLFPSPVYVLKLYDGVNGDLLLRAYVIPRSAAPRAPAPRQSTIDPYLHRRCSHTVLAQALWGSWVLVCTRFVWAFWASLAGMGFDSKHELAPPTALLGLLLCPWTLGISSQPL